MEAELYLPSLRGGTPGRERRGRAAALAEGGRGSRVERWRELEAPGQSGWEELCGSRRQRLWLRPEAGEAVPPSGTARRVQRAQHLPAGDEERSGPTLTS